MLIKPALWGVSGPRTAAPWFWQRRPYGVWPFLAARDRNARDYSPNRLVGTPTSTVPWEVTPWGLSPSRPPGGSDYYWLAPSPTRPSRGTLFILFANKFNGINDQILFSHDSGANDGYRVRINSGGSLLYTLGAVADYNTSFSVSANSTVPPYYALVLRNTGNGGTLTSWLWDYAARTLSTNSFAVGTMSGTPDQVTMRNLTWTSQRFYGTTVATYWLGDLLSDAEVRTLIRDPFAPVRPYERTLWTVPAAGGDVTVDATTDALTLTTHAAAVALDVDVQAGTAALTLTEQAAAIGLDVAVQAGTATLTLTEHAGSVAFDVAVQAGVDALALATHAATISTDVAVQAGTASLTLTELTASVNAATTVAATTDTLTLATHAAVVQAGANVEVQATTAALALTTHAASVSAPTVVAADTEALALTEHPATVNAAVNVQAATLALTIATHQAGVSLGVDVSAAVDALILSEHAASITYDVGVIAGTDTLNLTALAATIVVTGAFLEFDIEVSLSHPLAMAAALSHPLAVAVDMAHPLHVAASIVPQE